MEEQVVPVNENGKEIGIGEKNFRMSTKLKSFIFCIRYREALIFQAPAFVGLTFSISQMTVKTGASLIIFALGGFCLMAHVFCFNDWSDWKLDYRSPEKLKHILLNKGITSHEMLTLSVVLGMASLLIFALISSTLFIIAVMILSLGVVYSFPILRFQGKSIPLFSSILHIVGGLLTFQLGYAFFSAIGTRSLYIGGYFGLLLAAGHLVHEVQDYAGDRRNRISTNAVRFGPGFNFSMSFALSTFSFIYLFGLTHAGLIPSVLKYLLFFYPIYAVLAWKTFNAGLVPKNVRRFRNQYRILFGFVVIIMSVCALIYK